MLDTYTSQTIQVRQNQTFQTSYSRPSIPNLITTDDNQTCSSVMCGLTVMMFLCVKCCQCKAKSNDRKTVGGALGGCCFSIGSGGVVGDGGDGGGGGDGDGLKARVVYPGY